MSEGILKKPVQTIDQVSGTEDLGVKCDLEKSTVIFRGTVGT